MHFLNGSLDDWINLPLLMNIPSISTRPVFHDTYFHLELNLIIYFVAPLSISTLLNSPFPVPLPSPPSPPSPSSVSDLQNPLNLLPFSCSAPFSHEFPPLPSAFLVSPAPSASPKDATNGRHVYHSPEARIFQRHLWWE